MLLLYHIFYLDSTTFFVLLVAVLRDLAVVFFVAFFAVVLAFFSVGISLVVFLISPAGFDQGEVGI